MFKFRLFFYLALVWSTNVHASDKEVIDTLISLSFEELFQVTVATGLRQSSNRAPSVTSVITADDIRNMGARTLEEALRAVPGLQVSYNWFNVPIYTVRGISSGYNNPEILVLVNGVRMNENVSGSKGFNWAGFPVSTIERIEVIRGPGSALYGADALSGVINIITKNAEDINGTEFGIRAGNFNTQDAWVQHGSEWKGFNIAAMIDFGHTDGHQRIVESDAQTVFDNAFGTNASLAPGAYSSELTTYDAKLDISKQHWQLRASIHKTDNMGVGTGGAQALDPTTPVTEEIITSDLTYLNPDVADNWELKAQLSYWHLSSLVEYQAFPPGAFGGAYPIGYLGYPSTAERQSQLSLASTYHGLNDHTMTFGAGYAYYDLHKVGSVQNFGINPFTGETISPTELLDISDTSEIYMSEVARSNWHAFIQDVWKINSDWELTAGLRYDNYSDFGSTTNPRLGLVWQINEDLTTKLLYGQAFRAPSFQELHNQNNPVSAGNPNLKPEQIETWELAFNYHASEDLHFNLNLFHYDIKDKVTLVPQGTVFGYDNASSWKGHGFEFETLWWLTYHSNIAFNYSYQNGKDKTTNSTVSSGSQNMAYLRGDFLLTGNWHLNSQVNWNDGWSRDINDPRSDLDGHTTADLVLQYRKLANGKGRVGLGVRNVFDADVRYPSPGPGAGSNVVNVPNDLPAAGRFYFFEFSYKF